ncbi:tetratricopeptide (TPR) repeat protein [Bacillus thermophilus]|uniref:Tetratricopeptide (TPR) repeat protein n=1 Tax=Siminovitchia thermophila TaxID=1245522 RepID=A0ABS2R171_9BACI|nr:GTP-binding protein [Siminovitchia thermophila]MBM7713115.1 tetratricopeptide (TPR) repeat protein [Siminovitchia thermophila]
MEKEQYLVKKLYHEQHFLKGDESEHPIRVLGELYVSEQKKEMADLSYIRFAQGEVYFLNNDYEAAIFKWENIHNELEPWAKKNIADAYMELDLLSTAEEIYKSISSDSLILNTEISLQLFSLYLQQGKAGEADQMIKNAVVLNPDYENVTELACAFFEEQQDWESALDLTISEAVRTKSRQWFRKLLDYIENGHASAQEPRFFVPALTALQAIDFSLFEQMTVVLWDNFQKRDHYLSWLKELSAVIAKSEITASYRWNKLPAKFSDSFRKLLLEDFPLERLKEVVPSLLSSWLQVADSATAPAAAAGVLAWNDVFPASVGESSIQEAQDILGRLSGVADRSNLFMDSQNLFKSIEQWASAMNAAMNPKVKWMFQKLSMLDHKTVLIAGTSAGSKSSFVNMLLGSTEADFFDTSVPVLYGHGETTAFRLITNENIATVTTSHELVEGERKPDALIEYIWPNRFLADHRLSVIDFPVLHFPKRKESVIESIRMSACMFFILNEDASLTIDEQELLNEIKEHIPEYPVHFILQTNGPITNEKLDSVKQHVSQFFPDANFFAISGSDPISDSQLESILNEVDEKKNWLLLTGHLIFLIKKMIGGLLKQREKIQRELTEAIEFDEEVLTKIQGAIHQLYDLEEEKTKVLSDAYRSFKDEIKSDLLKTVPKLLKESADILQEDSDFGTIHKKLNDEMNKRISDYLQYTVHPTYISSLQDWISFSEGELNKAQEQLIEWNEGFNLMFGEERLELACDFQILGDWRRDADRMTGTIQIDKENILLKRTPAQVLLKSAGKLFGVIPANQSIMYKRYRQYIENENYDDTAESIAEKFFRQFELFEKAIPRDISLFFRNPYHVLRKSADELQETVDKNKAKLDDMKSNPEKFHNPLKLFDVRLRQLEWMKGKSKTGSRTNNSVNG